MPLYGVVVDPFVTVTSIVFVASALTRVKEIAFGAVGNDVGVGVAVTVTVGAGLAEAVGPGARVSVGMTISGDGVGVGVAAVVAFAVALAVELAANVGGTRAGWNGLRPTAAV